MSRFLSLQSIGVREGHSSFPIHRTRAESAIERESNLHGHLPVRDFIVLDVPAHFSDFEPSHVADRFGSTIDRVVYGVLDAVWGGTDKLDLFVDMVIHGGFITPPATDESKRQSYRQQ